MRVRGVRDGGGKIGRTIYQRPKEQALETLRKTVDVYLGKA
jgi:hypothetical protein